MGQHREEVILLTVREPQLLVEPTVLDRRCLPVSPGLRRLSSRLCELCLDLDRANAIVPMTRPRLSKWHHERAIVPFNFSSSSWPLTIDYRCELGRISRRQLRRVPDGRYGEHGPAECGRSNQLNAVQEIMEHRILVVASAWACATFSNSALFGDEMNHAPVCQT